MTSTVFIDASFWIAYRNVREQRQPAAARAVADLIGQRCRFVTTLPVICETHAFFARSKPLRAQVLRDLFNNPVVTIENVLYQDQDAALRLLEVNEDKTFPLCDAISFVVMRRLGINRVATFDIHFRQYGKFEVLPTGF